MTAFSLFALTNMAGRRVLRLPLSQDVQTAVTELFKAQEADFRTTFDEEVPFDGKYKPNDQECLVISDYNDIDDLHKAIASPMSIPEIKSDGSELIAIKGLFSGYVDPTGNKVALIQHFDRRKIISNAGFSIFFADNVYKKVDGVGITLNTGLAAILENTTLKFLNFFIARQIFDLTPYYNEATDADINAFAAMPGIHVLDVAQLIASADHWIRGKISTLAQSQLLQTLTPEAIATVASTFDIPVQTDVVNGRSVIVLPTNKTDLRKLLRFLDEDYYQSPLLNAFYLSSSKRRVK